MLTWEDSLQIRQSLFQLGPLSRSRVSPRLPAEDPGRLFAAFHLPQPEVFCIAHSIVC